MPRGQAPQKPQLVKQCGAATGAARMPTHRRVARNNGVNDIGHHPGNSQGCGAGERRAAS